MSRRRAATIYAVAEQAGVSIATVSRVLHGSGRTSDSARDRVLAAAARLDYQPQSSAQSLAGRRYQAHGLVLGDLAGPYYSGLLIGLEAAAAAAGQSVVVQIADGREDPERAVRELAARVDGLVVASSAMDGELLTALARDLPVVALGRGPLPGCDTVAAESRTAARELALHLRTHGRTSPLFIGDPTGSYDVDERHAGFLEAYDRSPTAPYRVPLTERAGAEAADDLYAQVRSGRADALVCANDELALVISRQLGRRGLRIGDDVAVTGWDDVMAARYVSPGLTTVRQPVHRMGGLAAALLQEQIVGPDAPTSHRLLPSVTVLRGSCGCPEPEGGLR